MSDYKVKPEEATGRVTFKKPIPCNPPLSAWDEKYAQRKEQLGSKSFTCKSGRQFSYFTDGAKDPSQDGVPVVLCLHGASQSKAAWILPEPFENIFLIVPDRFGHGLSSPTPPRGYLFSDGCTELLELVDRVYEDKGIPKDRKFFVTGHSMGGTWTIEMAACPETRDRIEAIAPISAPADWWHPQMTQQEKKQYKEIPGFLLRYKQKKGCCNCMDSLMQKFFLSLMVRKKGDDCIGDYGFAGQYKMLRDHCGGDEVAKKALAADPFFVCAAVDSFRKSCDKDSCIGEWTRCFAAGWCYDPADVKVPCFVYNGEKELTERICAEFHHKVIKGSDLILLPHHSHLTVSMEYPRIIEALVKKQKVEGACFAT
eukprot:TRINITY_DN36704_c0_g1_i1.p1 TRINITY_DN36704_c0_g1~~TRINITY_DN36704_c0_g1_i1.p1  ORF type:complete len:369 (+),score=60.01 TRINITY_DN36704_c0_g1_i1:56-1162(+)